MATEPLSVRDKPPTTPVGKPATLWRRAETGKIVCTACARYCAIGEGQTGLCGIRGVLQDKLWLYVYGKIITGNVDPIEKKPVMHYRPGSKIFSIATTGCNWLCHPAGTQIRMADGDTRPVEEVRPGDILWSVARGPTQDVVSAVGSRKAPTYRVRLQTGRPLLATLEHPVLTRRGWVTVGGLVPGDLVMRIDEAHPRGFDVCRVGDLPHSLGFHPRELSRFLKTRPGLPRETAGLGWSRVRGVTFESPGESVYSFESIPYHNYSAEGSVVHNCRYCFLPGTRVLTDQGHEPIEDVFTSAAPTEDSEVRLVGDRLAFTHRGRWRRVLKAFEHLYCGNVLTLKAYYLPGFECTPDHAVFASIAGGRVTKVKAKNLKVGDFLAIPKPQAERTRGAIDVKPILRSQPAPAYRSRATLVEKNGRVGWSTERGTGVPSRLRVTPRLARLLGYYCAEGSVSWHAKRANSGSTWFSFGAHEEERIREVESLLLRLFGARSRRSRQGNRTAVIVAGASLASVFRNLCGESSATKRVPGAILTSTNPSVHRGFLTGYFNGDGYVTKRKGGGFVLGSSSVSAKLSYGVGQLLFALGAVPRVYLAENDPEYVIEGRTVSRSNDVMVRLWADRVALTPDVTGWRTSRVRVIETPEYFLVPLREIDEREYIGPVYNVEVDEDHSYTANFAAVANCQNFDISQRRKIEGIDVEPMDVVRMTLEQGCQGLAYTYNQPTIWMEFAHDIGVAARKAGLINIFVSNGYDTPETVGMMGDFLDAITVDFKGSGETNFVRKYINIPNADPIFQTILEMRDKTKIHIEITDLIVPKVGDDLEACRKLSKWVYDELGPDAPIHFLRFHPDYKMMDFEWTPVATLEKHCEVAKAEGLRYAYIGNVPGHPYEHTYCPGCQKIAVKRHGFDITGWYLDKRNKCKSCGTAIPIQGSLEKTVGQDRFYRVLFHR